MSNRAILTGWLYLPLSALGSQGEIDTLKVYLTHYPRFMEPGDLPILLYTENRHGYLGVPREWGMMRYPDIEIDNQTTLGSSIIVPRRPNPNHPRVLDPIAQAEFIRNVRGGFDKYLSYTAMASTGSGKTVVALDTAAHLGRRTLILVHLNRLAKQWIEEIQDKLGVDRSRIGLIQQDKCEWEDKDFCVGILHSVAQRDYGQDFYNAFGFLIVDECHKIGSQFFAPAITKFPARNKLLLSATPTRKDGGDKVIFFHGGPIRVISNARALPLTVYVVDYTTTQPLFGKMKGSRVKCLTKDQSRNRLILTIIQRFYNGGRNTLIVSASISHLQYLMAEAVKQGIPQSVIGQYTAEVHDTVRGEDGKLRIVKRKQNDAVLDNIKATAQLIFATYGMVKEGIDIPRLDAGIDVTPESDATQLIGRVRRPMPGKRMPIWITIRDVSCAMSLRWFANRCRDYRATHAEVVRHGT